jgi:hypothetical protein
MQKVAGYEWKKSELIIIQQGKAAPKKLIEKVRNGSYSKTGK